MPLSDSRHWKVSNTKCSEKTKENEFQIKEYGLGLGCAANARRCNNIDALEVNVY